ncbi:hypothetical protein Leryth_019903 [Lithospermum erythrorhizon]|nr:hypothetical protein Leryth_019903 [Lithospermum erythrorhizon]
MTSVVLSVVFTFIVMKLNLTTGVIPSLNVAAGLQENTVIQKHVLFAFSGIAFSSGTASYLLAMSDVIASRTDSGNSPINIKRLNLGWIIGFLFVVSFIGLFSIMPLRKMMILKYKLTYPSGTATWLTSYQRTSVQRREISKVSYTSALD